MLQQIHVFLDFFSMYLYYTEIVIWFGLGKAPSDVLFMIGFLNVILASIYC